jgi:hypothetical protein
MMRIAILSALLGLVIQINVSAQAKEIQVKPGDNRLLLTSNTYQELSFSLDIAHFELRQSKSQNGLFTDILLPEAQHSIEVGSPRLPRINRLIEIPVGCEPVIEIQMSAYQDFNLSALGFTDPIFPAQGPLIKSASKHPFHMDQAAYQSTSFLPNEMVRIEYVGEMRGVRIARISIDPFLYAPAQGLLRLYHSLNVNVSFTGADLEATLRKKETFYSPHFESTLHHLWNFKSPETTGGAAEDVMSKYPIKYVIVSDSSFRQALQPLVSWKRRKGFIVVEAYKQNPGVGSTTTSIKAYLQGLYLNATPSSPAPTYVLFVGDVAQMPSFSASGHVTDRNYVEYTGDALPEVYYGRFSATTVQQVQSQVAKTLEYEQYLMSDPGFLNQVVLIAGADGTYGPLHANGQINYGANTYFNSAHGLLADVFLYPGSSSNAAQIRQIVGSGVALANYTAHGDASGWADPAFNAGHVAAMTNNGRYPLMIGNACLTNKFDSPECFGEALLRANNKGAIGYIGASNNTYWDEDYYWSVGLGTISANPSFSSTGPGMYDRWVHDHNEPYQEWYYTQAQMMFAGNLAVTQSGSSVNYYWEIYHLMGDPSLMPYLGMPDPMQVSYTPLLPLGLTQFSINAVPYAHVAITRNDTLYGAALADSNGYVNLSIIPFTSSGVAEVIVTAQNYQPFIGTVLTASPSGPYLDVEEALVDDAAGNSNGKADYTEQVVLDLKVRNLTSFAASNVSISISTSDTSMISLIDTIHSMTLLPGSSSLTTTNAFAIKVKDFVPDGYMVPFTVRMNDNMGGNWVSSFKLMLNAPKMKIISLEIDDVAGGNGNGRIDPGESITIKLVGSNIGHADAGKSGLGLLSSDHRVTLSSNGLNVNQFNAGDTLNLNIPAQVFSLAPHGTVVTFSASLISGLYADQKILKRMIGDIDEDFESGNLSKFSWQSSGNLPWVVDNSDVHEGAFSAHSGTILDQQKSILSISMNVIADDSIRFHRKVSSEPYYDFLEFYIDGNLIEQWSGTLNWGEVSIAVSAGQHEFKWIYTKDYYLANGQDKAWIDNIIFPPTDLWSSTAESEPISSRMTIYPNPGQGIFQISIDLATADAARLMLFDVSGRMIRQFGYEGLIGLNTLSLDLSGLPEGMYLLRIEQANSINTGRIIITGN